MVAIHSAHVAGAGMGGDRGGMARTRPSWRGRSLPRREQRRLLRALAGASRSRARSRLRRGPGRPRAEGGRLRRDGGRCLPGAGRIRPRGRSGRRLPRCRRRSTSLRGRHVRARGRVHVAAGHGRPGGGDSRGGAHARLRWAALPGDPASAAQRGNGRPGSRHVCDHGLVLRHRPPHPPGNPGPERPPSARDVPPRARERRSAGRRAPRAFEPVRAARGPDPRRLASVCGQAVTLNPDWEQEAENWITWARSPDHDAYLDYSPSFFELVPPPGRATLEIGCGEGRVARDLAARGHRVTGIDASPTLLDAARAADPNGEYVLADAASLPFTDESFDLAGAYNSLQVVDDMAAAVREAGRVLRPGGHLCICIVHPFIDPGRFAASEADAPFVLRQPYFGSHRVDETIERAGIRMRFYGWTHTLEEYSRAFEAAGFLIEALREPRLPDEAVAADPAEARWQRLPLFLFIRAVSSAAASTRPRVDR